MDFKPTIVVNVRHTTEYDVYIGRGNSPLTTVEKLPAGGSFGNPFPVNHLCTREESIRLFKQLLDQNIDPRAQWINANLWRLQGKRIGCWCKPADCHGDVLAERADAVFKDARRYT